MIWVILIVMNDKCKARLNWINIAFFIATPILTLVSLPLYIYFFDFLWADVILFFVLFFLTMTSITCGYHRLFSHRAYKAHPIVKVIYLFFGAGTYEGSAIEWSSDHRIHHKYVDTDQDPYNAKKGFFWSHIGWVFYCHPAQRNYDNVKDLFADPLVRFQHKNYFSLSVFVAFILPTVIGIFYGSPLGGLIWGGLFRLVVGHHSTFLINSAAHFVGKKPFSSATTARDSWIIALFSWGEGYHNFHHTFAGDYRNGVRWYAFDPSKWIIFGLNKASLAWNLQRTPEQIMWKTRIYEKEKTTRSFLMEKGEEMALKFEETFKKELHDLKEKMLEKSHALTRIQESYKRWLLTAEQKIYSHKIKKKEKKDWRVEIKQKQIEARHFFKQYYKSIHQIMRELNRSYN